MKSSNWKAIKAIWTIRPVYEVPPDHYFMMGDNRDNSLDSRVSPEREGVGYVPFENLIGRAEVIFFSVEEGEPAWQVWRWPWIVRWRRLFQRGPVRNIAPKVAGRVAFRRRGSVAPEARLRRPSRSAAFGAWLAGEARV